jgi:hypothetical protein
VPFESFLYRLTHAMYEVPTARSRSKLLLGSSCAVGVALVALAAYSVLTPSVRARATTGPEPVSSIVVQPPGLPASPPALSPAPAAPIAAPAPAPATLEGWPAGVSGRVRDSEGRPLARAAIVVDGRETWTDAEGAFTLGAVPAHASLIVKSAGYAKVTIAPTHAALDVTLKPKAVKGAYLTYYGFADRQIRGRVLGLIARTELNAVVIDVKGDRGWIPYRTEVPLALAAGAQGPVILKDFDGMLADLRAQGIYTIARIVVFKDNVLANHRRDLAIIDTRTRKPWMDRENLAWVDPFRTEVWDYNIAIAREAIRKGFDEVQFDYVRFPTDGKLAAARYSKPNSKETRLPTIAGFLERARAELGSMGAFVSADVFGYTAFNENDTDIGQRIEELAPHLDYISPMVYPSGYQVGIPGYRNPVLHPYQIVHESVRLIRKRAAGFPVQVRPWLQDFKDYAFDRRIFGVPEIRAQIKGSDEAGGRGWMLWNPKNDYTGAALRPKGTLAAK